MGLQVVTSISYCYCYIVEVDEPNQKIYTKFQAHAYMQKKISNNRMNKKNIYTKSWSSIIIKSEYIIIEQNQRFWSIKKYITKKNQPVLIKILISSNTADNVSEQIEKMLRIFSFIFILCIFDIRLIFYWWLGIKSFFFYYYYLCWISFFDFCWIFDFTRG